MNFLNFHSVYYFSYRYINWPYNETGESTMLHLGDIKVVQNNNPAAMKEQQGAKSIHDFSSDVSFFSILKGQVQTGEQTTSLPADRPEPARNIINAAAEDRKPREDAARTINKEETSQAIGKTEEQGQKAAAQIQGKEAKGAETKNSVEKKPVPEQQGALVDKGAEAGARARLKQKEKKTADSDMQNIQEGLHRMIDFLKGKDQPEIRSIKASAQELHDLLRDSKKNPDRGLLKKSLDKLADAIDGLAGKMQAGKSEHLAGTMAGIKDILKKMKAADEKQQARKQDAAADAVAPAVRDLLAKMEVLLDGAKGDGSHQRSGSNDQGNSTTFNFSAIKSDMAAKQADTAAAAPKNSLFRENLESIIQNARVVVKDSRNGSFSVRLHPEELGSVNISLSLHDGVMRGKFLVETQDAKDLLTGNLDDIKQQLQNAGITVGEFQVDVNDRRGRHLQDRDDDRIAFIAPAGQTPEIESSFASNALGYHDGHINLFI
jgi:flagellar hook-length control protein FliK